MNDYGNNNNNNQPVTDNTVESILEIDMRMYQ